MAKEQKEAAQVHAKTERKPAEPEYSAPELAANAKTLFGTRPECVAAALKAAGKEKTTVSEAGNIVGAFLKKEVK